MARVPKAMSNIDHQVAALLRETASTRGVSQKWIEKNTGIKQGRISTIFLERTPAATTGEVEAIATALGTSIEQILQQAKPPQGDAKYSTQDSYRPDGFAEAARYKTQQQ